MISLALIFNIFISVVFPLGTLVYFIARRRSLVKPWLLGLATFLVFQLLTRVPLLQYWGTQSWFQNFAANNLVVYSLLLGLSAGVFEEVGRFIVMKLFMKRNHSFADGAAHGLGHGGFEALALVGINCLVYLLVSFGLFTSPALEVGMIQLENTGALNLFLGGFERIFAMMLHVGFSVMVLRGIRKNRAGLHLLCAILIHAFVDGMLGILQSWGWNIYAIEAFVAACGLFMLVYTIIAKRKEKKEVVPHEETA